MMGQRDADSKNHLSFDGPRLFPTVPGSQPKVKLEQFREIVFGDIHRLIADTFSIVQMRKRLIDRSCKKIVSNPMANGG